MRLLIDHTTLHSLLHRPAGPVDQLALRGVLQLIEELVFADEIALANTEGTSTLGFSTALVGLLNKEGGPSLIPISIKSVTRKQFRATFEVAAEKLFEFLLDQQGDSPDEFNDRLRERAKIHVAHKWPAGIQPRDFPGLFSRLQAYGDESAEAAIDEALDGKEFLSTAAPLLLNEKLFEWAKSCAARVPDNRDPLYEHLNTVLRWAINTSLATALSGSGNSDATLSPFQYAPSYGRALTISQSYLPASVAAKHLLNVDLWKLWLEKRRSDPEGRSTLAAASRPLPVVGAALVIGLSKKPTFTELIDRVLALRTDQGISALRKWLRDAPQESDRSDAINQIRKRLGLSSEIAFVPTARFSLCLPAAFTEGVGFKTNERYPLFSMPARTALWRALTGRPHATVLTSYLEPLLVHDTLRSDLLSRVASIQKSIRAA